MDISMFRYCRMDHPSIRFSGRYKKIQDQDQELDTVLLQLALDYIFGVEETATKKH